MSDEKSEEVPEKAQNGNKSVQSLEFGHEDLLKTFLKLKHIDENTFSSTYQLPGRKGSRRVYGGQVVGQALMAANNTIDPAFHPHSLHCQFLAPADKRIPIIYEVIRVRDGRSFSTRLVQAKQNGETCFTTSISFQKIEPDSIRHEPEMPRVPPPEECEDAQAFFQRLLDDPQSVSPEGQLAAEAYRKVLDMPHIFGIKIIRGRDFIRMPTHRPMRFALWVRSNAPIGDDEHLHHCVAAFISDIAPVGTPICANAASGFRLGMAASLDHCMWIHRHDFRMDEDWVLYETESPIGAASRALIHGKMWTRDGRLVLSTAQEILVRAERGVSPEWENQFIRRGSY